jgi:hypothetical protein
MRPFLRAYGLFVRNPDKMRVRRQTVEHLFGTIKGSHPLPNDAVSESSQRNAAARAGLQHEARDAHSERRRIDGRHAGLRPVLMRPNQSVWMTTGGHQGSLASIFAGAIRQIIAGIAASAIGLKRERSHSSLSQSVNSFGIMRLPTNPLTLLLRACFILNRSAFSVRYCQKSLLRSGTSPDFSAHNL